MVQIVHAGKISTGKVCYQQSYPVLMANMAKPGTAWQTPFWVISYVQNFVNLVNLKHFENPMIGLKVTTMLSGALTIGRISCLLYRWDLQQNYYPSGI